MKRKKLMGWKRMAAFAMALSLTLGDGTSVGVVAAQVSDTQAAVETTTEVATETVSESEAEVTTETAETEAAEAEVTETTESTGENKSAEQVSVTTPGKIVNLRKETEAENGETDQSQLTWDADQAAKGYQIRVVDAGGVEYAEGTRSYTNAAGEVKEDLDYYSTDENALDLDELRWNSLRGYKADGNGGFTTVVDENGNQLRIKDNTTYTIQVRAYNDNDGVTAFGEWSDADTYNFPRKEDKAEAVTGIVKTKENGNVSIEYQRGNNSSVEMEITDASGRQYYSYEPGVNPDGTINGVYYSNSTGSINPTSVNAYTYEVVKDADGNTYTQKVKDTDGNPLKAFNAGETYTVRLRGVGYGTEKTTSDWSQALTVTVPETAVPAVTGQLKYDIDEEEVSWNEVTGAAGYEVELKDAAGNWYNTYGDEYDKTTDTYKTQLKNFSTSSTSLSVGDENVYELSAEGDAVEKKDEQGNTIVSGKAGTTYTVRVRAYNYKKNSSEKQYSEWSAPLTYTVAGVTAPGKVTGVKVSETEATWDEESEQYGSDYQVEIKDASGRLYTNYPSYTSATKTYDYNNYPSTSGTSQDLTDFRTYVEQDGKPVAVINTKTGKEVTSMEKGQTYTIRVRASRTVDGQTVYGEWSDAYTYTVPTGDQTEGVNAKPAKVTGVWIQTEADADQNIYAPTIRWNDIENVARYDVEVKDSKGNLYSNSPDYYNNAYHTNYIDTDSNINNIYSFSNAYSYTENGEKLLDTAGNPLQTFVQGETYTIRVRAVNRYRIYDQTAQKWSEYTQYDGDWSDPVTFKPTGKVTALTGLKLSRQDEDYYYFSYNYNVDNFKGNVFYQIATAADFADASLVKDWTQASNAYSKNKLAISKTDSSLKPATTYYVRVVASNYGAPYASMEKSRYESIMATAASTSFTTIAQKTPKNIKGLKVYSESGDGYQLRFNSVLDVENGDYYEIQFANDANSANWSKLTDNDRWIEKDSLPEGKSYLRAVAYVNVYNEATQKYEKVYGQPSNVITIKKNTVTTTAIGKIALVEESKDAYTFSYSGALRLDEDVQIWYSDSKKFETNQNGTTTNYTEYSANKNKKISLSKNELIPGKTYYVKLRTVNTSATKAEEKYSKFSNVVKVKAAVPEISVDCSYVTKDSITLTMSGDEYVTGYEIQKKSVKNKKTVWTTLAQTASPSYTDSKLKADTTYSYRVRPYFFNTDTNKTVKGAWEYCEAMTGWGGALKLHAKAASKTSVKLDWSKISGAKGYEVYKYVGGSDATEIVNGEGNAFSKYKLVADLSSSKKSYTDKGLTSGMTYYYVVKAYKMVGNKKVYVESRQNVTLDFELTKVNQYQKANGKVTVTWNPVYEAKGYLIEKLDSASGKWNKYKTIKKAATSSYTFPSTKDTEGVTYRIRAYSGKNYTNSIGVSVKPVLAAPTKVTAKATKNGIKVSWKAVKGADYYKVYRTEVKDGVYNKDTKSYNYFGATEVGTFVKDSSKVSGYRLRTADDMKVTSVEDRKITYSANGVKDIVLADGPASGVKYYYYVVACKKDNSTDGYVHSNDDSAFYISGASKAASATFKEAKPAATSITKATSKSKKVTLKYKASKTADGYEIERSTNKKKGFTAIKDVNKAKTVTYVDKNSKKNVLKKGKTYYYRVRAYKYNDDGSKVYSKYSKVKAVKIK